MHAWVGQHVSLHAGEMHFKYEVNSSVFPQLKKYSFNREFEDLNSSLEIQYTCLNLVKL